MDPDSDVDVAGLKMLVLLTEVSLLELESKTDDGGIDEGCLKASALLLAESWLGVAANTGPDGVAKMDDDDDDNEADADGILKMLELLFSPWLTEKMEDRVDVVATVVPVLGIEVGKGENGFFSILAL